MINPVDEAPWAPNALPGCFKSSCDRPGCLIDGLCAGKRAVAGVAVIFR